MMGWIPPANRSNQHIQRWNSWLYPRSVAAAQTIREILAKPDPMLIPPRFRVGTKVLFRIDQDNKWMPADRLRGRIIQRFHNRIWFYVVQDSEGMRYSIPHYKAIMPIKDELMVVEQPVTALAIVPKATVQPQDAAGEKAA